MAEHEYDETKAAARLPGLDIEILHRRPLQDQDEQVLITIRAAPSFEAFGRFAEIANPLLFWTQMMQMAWSPWLPRIPQR
jgi:hypothetical protein